jgi:hypothetical protein
MAITKYAMATLIPQGIDFSNKISRYATEITTSRTAKIP